MEVSWDSFYSDVGMFLYYVALSSQPVDNSTCQSYTDGGDMSDIERQKDFDIADRLNTGDETYALLQNLSMTHDSDVYVHVIGVDRAGMCRMISRKVHIDITPPVTGRVKCGPYYDRALAFAPTSSQVTVDWDSFTDAESPLASFTVELMMQPTCNVSAPRGGDVLKVTIGANYSSYILRLADHGQSLTPGHPYFVRVTAENAAGLSTNVISAPLLFDDSVPVPGHVVDGFDFQRDVTWVGSNSTVTAMILHLATPLGVACSPRLLPFDTGIWQLASSSASYDHTGRQLDLVTQPSKASILSPNDIKVTLTRDTNQGHMYTASLLHDADIANGGAYELDVQAADGEGMAVTSVTLWDGEGDDVIHCDFTVVVETEFCMCCFDEEQRASNSKACMIACKGCTTYESDYENRNTQVESNNTIEARRRRRRSAGVQQLSEDEKARLEAGESHDDVMKAEALKRSPACGMQLYTLQPTDRDYVKGSRGRVVIWCTYGEDVLYEAKHVEKSLTFDPSASSHHYKLHVFETVDEEAAPTRCVSVSIDYEDVSTAELRGIPTLSPSTRLALSVWNWKNFLSHSASNDDDNSNNNGTNNNGNNGNDNNNDNDGNNGNDNNGNSNDNGNNGNNNNNDNSIALWQASAIFSNVTIPAEASQLCRYGNPFRGGQNPIVGYEAGVGSDVEDDVVQFRQVHEPCFPCIHECDNYGCDPSCDPSLILPLTLTLEGLNLSSVTETSEGEAVPIVYYFTVKAVLGSGRSTVVSSDGFSIDTSAPVTDPSHFFYLDVAQGKAKPVEKLMASNSTIQVLYRCRDNESDVVEYEWAIGTTPGGQEVQNYTSTGLYPTGKNDQLLGVITHNTNYYVSFRCTNGAGLHATYEDQTGIVAYIEPLNLTDVDAQFEGTDPIGNDVVPPTASQSSSSTSVSVALTVSDDLTVDLYYFSIGSRTEVKMDDICSRMLVAQHVSGTITIRDGNMYKNDELMFPLGAVSADFNETADGSSSEASDFQMEPGREMFAFVDSCNEAQCTGLLLVGSVVVISPLTQAVVSIDGSSVRVELSSITRRKRSAAVAEEEDPSEMQSSRVKRSVDQVFVTTPDGLQAGQTVMLTEITHAELTASYESVASPSFVSYLTDPTYTLSSVSTVDRILAGRAAYNPDTDVAFSLLSVGQIEMPGPILVTFPFDPTDTESTIQLIHWNPDLQKWQRSADTCENEIDTGVKDFSTSTITVKVCDTYGGGGYFAEQTLFLLSSVNNTIPNDEPQLISASDASMLEDEGTLIYQVETTDADGDVVIVSLDSPALSPAYGDLSLTPTNLLLFTPCLDCSGSYQLRLLLSEEEVEGIPPNTASATVTVTVTSVNDAPVIFLLRHGVSLLADDPTADVEVLLEQNKKNQTDQVSYTFVFGAYDVDVPSTLVFIVEGPAFGTLHLGDEVIDVPDCSSDLPVQEDTIPCQNMSLPHPPSSLSWRYMTLTYRPDDGFHGYDTVRLLATDEEGMGSDVATIRFGVMEQPCENGGTCVAKDPDTYTCEDARRVETFDVYYSCNCSEGFEGRYCDGDLDDCLSNPCHYPYVCVDQVNAYRCQCADDNPDCDGLEGWMVAVIVISCLVAVGLVVLGVLLWAFRTGRLKCRLLKARRPGSADSLSRLKILKPSSTHGIDNQAFDPSQSAPTSPKMARSHRVHDPLREEQLKNFGLTIKPRFFQSSEVAPLPHPSSAEARRHSSANVFLHGKNARHHLPTDPQARRASESVSIGSTPSAERPITPVERYEKW